MSLQEIVRQFALQKVLVIGDVILDEYLIGLATRMSREAPIPVLELTERRYVPGGAANPATNIVTLGGKAWQVGVVGEDNAAAQLISALQAQGINTDGIVTHKLRQTTVKTRVLAQMGLRFPQQVARIDTLATDDIDDATQKQLLSVLHVNAPVSGAVLFSDYRGGVLSESFIRQAQAIGRQAHVLLTADAQGNLGSYHGFDLVKCNADDAAAFIGQLLTTEQDFADAANKLREELQLEAMVITRGASGATLATSEGVVHCPAPDILDVYDTVGAGDTAIAVMTLARLTGASWQDSVQLANYASGIVIQHVGNYAPSVEEVIRAVES